MAKHILTGTGAPAIRPEHPGQHYVDEAADPRVTYIGLSTDSQTPIEECWQEVGAGGGGATFAEYAIGSGAGAVPLTLNETHVLVFRDTGGPESLQVDLSAIISTTPDPTMTGDICLSVQSFSSIEFLGIPMPFEVGISGDITVSGNTASWQYTSYPMLLTIRVMGGIPLIHMVLQDTEIQPAGG